MKNENNDEFWSKYDTLNLEISEPNTITYTSKTETYKWNEGDSTYSQIEPPKLNWDDVKKFSELFKDSPGNICSIVNTYTFDMIPMSEINYDSSEPFSMSFYMLPSILYPIPVIITDFDCEEEDDGGIKYL
jgi:hypothetical protein